MSPEAQRIAIAEAMNLDRLAPIERRTRKGKPDPEGVTFWYMEANHGGFATWTEAPDYLSDLNAMHEAEKTLPTVMDIPGDPATIPMGLYCQMLFDWCNERGVWACHIPADVRAEMFLRTIGKWEGGPQ